MRVSAELPVNTKFRLKLVTHISGNSEMADQFHFRQKIAKKKNPKKSIKNNTRQQYLLFLP